MSHLPNPNISAPAPDHGWVEESGTLMPLWFEGDVVYFCDISYVSVDFRRNVGMGSNQHDFEFPLVMIFCRLS